jgi:hypothetical protein
VVEAVELGNRTEPDSSTNEPFSARHGYAGNAGDAEISIREEAPEELRRTVVDIATKTGWDYDGLLNVASRIGKQPWEPSEPIVSSKQSRLHLGSLVSTWDWYWVYDFIEQLYSRMAGWSVPETEPALPCEDLEDLINGYFRHAGIGWELREGKIITRGGEEFQEAVKAAASQLVEDHRPTAAGHIQSAVRALSTRPKANTPGAVSHATSSVECVLNDITGEATTLGRYLDKYPKLFHPSLKKALVVRPPEKIRKNNSH